MNSTLARTASVLVLRLLSLAAIGCSTAAGGSGDPDGGARDTGGSSDSDADGDSDTDTDGDTDGDVDGDSDSDSSSDTDTATADDCVEDSYQQCSASMDVHWFDSCDVQGKLAMDCDDDCQACENTTDTTAECRATEVESYKACSDDGNVHWYDSCSKEGAVAEECSDSNELCDQDAGACACKSGWTGHSCETATECAGKDDFVFCFVDTMQFYFVDYSYDICVDEKCISPGTCEDYTCNVPGPHFTPPPALRSENANDDLERSQPEAGTGEYVVFDSATGLTWQGCPAGLMGASCDQEDWRGTGSFEWKEALEYCDKLVWGGFTDWYLPDEWELQSVIDYGSIAPALDKTAFPGDIEHWSWSSSVVSTMAAFYDIWTVSLSFGGFRKGFFLSQEGTRCVRRDPQSVPTNRFTRSEPIAGEPVVADGATALMWQGCVAGQSGDVDGCTGDTALHTWSGAADYCGTLNSQNYGGFGDWYLPDVKELHTITENRVAQEPFMPRIDDLAFPDTPSLSYWTSTPRADSTEAWEVDFLYGDNDTAAETTENAVRCVRDVKP